MIIAVVDRGAELPFWERHEHFGQHSSLGARRDALVHFRRSRSVVLRPARDRLGFRGRRGALSGRPFGFIAGQLRRRDDLINR